MIRLIKNEFTKFGIVKFILPYIIFLIVIILEYYYNGYFNNDYLLKLIPYVGMILCILFSSIISNEMTSGTFKYYLTKSSTRFKVLTSKLLFVYVYTFILVLFLLIVSIIITRSISFHFIIKLLCYLAPIYCILSFTVLLSVIIRNTPINTGACIFFLIFGGLIAEFLFKKDIKIVQYTLLPYLDFNIFSSKESIRLINIEYGINLNMVYGLIINMIHIVVSNLLSYFIFIKKDIKC